MGRSPEPVVLELATLPREQVGPFLLLGLDKAADQKAIDAHWADRLKWARKGQSKVPLEDINWAREVLHDTERRIRADAASLNADTSDGVLAQFAALRRGRRPGRSPVAAAGQREGAGRLPALRRSARTSTPSVPPWSCPRCPKRCRPCRCCSNVSYNNRWIPGPLNSKSEFRTRTTEMSADFLQGVPGNSEPGTSRDLDTLGSSTMYKLCEEVIALREYDKRQLRSLEQTLNKVRDELKTSFNSFAADTQRAYQQLRQETHGEKRVSLALLNELIETAHDLRAIVAARPSLDDLEAVKRWIEAVEVESRKVDAALLRHGIQPYDAVISAAYNPAIHERVGSKRVEGMGPLLVAEQIERGYASQQPEFVLRRPKVIVSE